MTKQGVQEAPPGPKSNMPAFSDVLSDAEIWVALAYIKSRWPEPIRSRQAEIFRMGLLYIFLFGLGSIVGMAILSAAISLPLRLTVRHFAWADRGLTTGVGVLTILVGVYVLFETGLSAGLPT